MSAISNPSQEAARGQKWTVEHPFLKVSSLMDFGHLVIALDWHKFAF